MTERQELREALWSLFDVYARALGIVWLADRLNGITERWHR